jgi:hypothetical protein
MDAVAWRDAAEAYYTEHGSVDTGPDARGPAMLVIEKDPDRWRVQQIVGDPEGEHGWRIFATVDLAASDEAGELVLRTTGLHEL